MQQVGQCCVGAKICWLWTIKASNWHQRSGAWTLSAAPHLPFFSSGGSWRNYWFISNNKFKSLRPKKWLMLIDSWNKKFPQRRKWRLDIDWVRGCMEVGGACTSGIWTDDPLYWPDQMNAGRRRSVRTPAIYKSSVGLWPTLPRQVNTTSEDSSSISSFSCHPVFLSLPVSHSNGGHPYPPPPQVMWKTRVCTSKLMKKCPKWEVSFSRL